MKTEDFKFTVKDITEIAVLCAFAIVLDTFVKIPIFATGGSINISMIPLLIVSLHKGWFKGFVCGGIIFGFLTCLIDGYAFSTYPFDYLIGFGSVFATGLFKNKILNSTNITAKNYFYLTLSILVVFIIRLAGSTISGMLVYGLEFIPSLVYQLTYLIPSFTAILLILVPLLKFLKATFIRIS